MNELEYKLGLVEPTTEDELKRLPCGRILKEVPKISQTYEMLKYVCEHDGKALKHASKKLITPELCEIAVLQNAMALEFVPSKIINSASEDWVSNLYKIAVSNNGRALEFVPDEYKTDCMVENAVTYYYKHIHSLPANDNKHYVETVKLNEELRERAKLEGEELEEYYHYPIFYVPKLLLSSDVILKSVSYSPLSLRDIPKNKITKEIAFAAVKKNGSAIQYVPNKFMTEELVNIAVENNSIAIKYVPEELINQELCNKCLANDYALIKYIPETFITKEMCIKVAKTKRFCVIEPSLIQKTELYGNSDVELVLFEDLPEKYRSDIDVLNVIIARYKYGSLPLLRWNESITFKTERNDISRLKNSRGELLKPLHKKTIDYLITRKIEPEVVVKKEDYKPLLLPNEKVVSEKEYSENYALSVPNNLCDNSLSVVSAQSEMMVYNFSDEDISEKIYYISDIHIEHHFIYNKKLQKVYEKIRNEREKEAFFLSWLEGKVAEMISGADNHSMLLIGGDVADNVQLEKAFYDCLYRQWRGTIVSVLGNHELWDGTTLGDWLNLDFKSRSIEEIVADYKKSAMYDFDTAARKYYLLENDVLVQYRGQQRVIISMDDILSASDEELTELLSKCSLIILGGIGYSGLNSEYNAEMVEGNKSEEGLGLYRKALLTREEDIRRTQIFKALYDKVLKCAGNKKVIVLTHTQVQDWNSNPEMYHPNWIYVNGHTHINAMKRTVDGITVLSDNQIGYGLKREGVKKYSKPFKITYMNPKWKLNAFIIDKCIYDPFENYTDGIYTITSEQYKEFNTGRGIVSNGCNYEGTLLMLKKEGMYMFLLQTAKSLCLLAGGQRKKLDYYDVNYYFDNMSIYGEKVKLLIKPYQNVMQQLSEEIKKFGADGTIHGCIIDISWFSHIYVNPFDGKVTVYWALDIYSRKVYNSIQELLEAEEPLLLSAYEKQVNSNQIPMVKNYLSKDSKAEFTTVPQWIGGTEMYEPSRIVKSVQYVWEQNVIRIWNDNVLYSDGRNELPQSQKLLEG